MLHQSVSEDRADDMEALYLDLGLVMDSHDGGLEESEGVEDGVGKGGQEMLLSGAPLPKHFGHVLGICWGIALGQGPGW